MGLLMLGISELACGSVRTGGFDSARGDADKRKKARTRRESYLTFGVSGPGDSLTPPTTDAPPRRASERGVCHPPGGEDGDKRKKARQGGPFFF